MRKSKKRLFLRNARVEVSSERLGVHSKALNAELLISISLMIHCFLNQTFQGVENYALRGPDKARGGEMLLFHRRPEGIDIPFIRSLRF